MTPKKSVIGETTVIGKYIISPKISNKMSNTWTTVTMAISAINSGARTGKRIPVASKNMWKTINKGDARNSNIKDSGDSQQTAGKKYTINV